MAAFVVYQLVNEEITKSDFRCDALKYFMDRLQEMAQCLGKAKK